MIKFKTRVNGIAETLLKMPCKAAEATVAVQVAKDTEEYVPALTGSLTRRTRVIGNKIIYPGPYARYLYFGKVMVDSATGKGPMKIPDVGLRFKKGAVLVATERDLTYSKGMHKNAQSHWFEASKAQNSDKWIKTAEEVVKYELRKR